MIVRIVFFQGKYHKLFVILPFFILQALLVLSQNNSNTEQVESFRSNTEQIKVEQLQTILTKTPDSLLKISTSYIKNGDFDLALQYAQEALRISKKTQKNKQTGNSLNKIATIYYYKGNYTEALFKFKKSIPFYNKINFNEGIASSINNQGAIYYHLGNYPKALDHYKRTVKLNEAIGDKKQKAASLQNIGGIYVELKDYSNAMKYFEMAKTVLEDVLDERAMSQVLDGIGEIQLKQGNYPNALINLEKSLILAEKIGDKQKILETVLNLGKLYDQQKDYKKSLEYYNRSLAIAEAIKSARYKSLSLIAIGSVNLHLNKLQPAINHCKKGLVIAQALNAVSVEKEACTCLYQVYKMANNKAIALNYYEQANILNDSLLSKETADEVLSMEFEKQMLVDSLANVEKKHKLELAHRQAIHKKERQRNLLLVSGFLVLVLAGGLWSRLNYTKKSKARLQVEKDRSEHLLLNILPEEIADELKEKGYVDVQDFDTASILFTDFKSFTETASRLTPQELVEEINVCFKAFDGIIDRYGIEKIKTIGDAYMAAGGLTKPSANAIKSTILAALDMQEFILQRKVENDLLSRPAFEMRVGIHVGPIVAGIVGVKKFQYDIWGDTVNTASRMESNGSVGKVNISQDTYQLVKNEKTFIFEYRGKVHAKGKGEMEMYFVRKQDLFASKFDFQKGLSHKVCKLKLAGVGLFRA